jgi:hypothetical protein
MNRIALMFFFSIIIDGEQKYYWFLYVDFVSWNFDEFIYEFYESFSTFYFLNYKEYHL